MLSKKAEKTLFDASKCVDEIGEILKIKAEEMDNKNVFISK